MARGDGLWITRVCRCGIRHHRGMSHRAELPRDLNGQPFLAREAHERGVPWSRLRGPDLAAPFRGVRAPVGSTASVYDRARAYEKRMPATHVFSHVTAAALHGIPLPYRLQLDGRLHVTAPAGTRAPQIRGVVGHELRPELMDIEVVYGLPVTTPLQTWIDLGTLLSTGELVAVADYVCGGKYPRYAPVELRGAASALHGRRGCRALREAQLSQGNGSNRLRRPKRACSSLSLGCPSRSWRLRCRFPRATSCCIPTWRGQTSRCAWTTRVTSTGPTKSDSDVTSRGGRCSRTCTGASSGSRKMTCETAVVR
jgi:hypothetical protein